VASELQYASDGSDMRDLLLITNTDNSFAQPICEFFQALRAMDYIVLQMQVGKKNGGGDHSYRKAFIPAREVMDHLYD
jgi:hypothetical protein